MVKYHNKYETMVFTTGAHCNGRKTVVQSDRDQRQIDICRLPRSLSHSFLPSIVDNFSLLDFVHRSIINEKMPLQRERNEGETGHALSTVDYRNKLMIGQIIASGTKKRSNAGSSVGANFLLRYITEGKIKVCSWFREISSCSCLTVLPWPAWVLLSKTYKPLFTPLYSK